MMSAQNQETPNDKKNSQIFIDSASYFIVIMSTLYIANGVLSLSDGIKLITPSKTAWSFSKSNPVFATATAASHGDNEKIVKASWSSIFAAQDDDLPLKTAPKPVKTHVSEKIVKSKPLVSKNVHKKKDSKPSIFLQEDVVDSFINAAVETVEKVVKPSKPSFSFWDMILTEEKADIGAPEKVQTWISNTLFQTDDKEYEPEKVSEETAGPVKSKAVVKKETPPKKQVEPIKNIESVLNAENDQDSLFDIFSVVTDMLGVEDPDKKPISRKTLKKKAKSFHSYFTNLKFLLLSDEAENEESLVSKNILVVDEEGDSSSDNPWPTMPELQIPSLNFKNVKDYLVPESDDIKTQKAEPVDWSKILISDEDGSSSSNPSIKIPEVKIPSLDLKIVKDFLVPESDDIKTQKAEPVDWSKILISDEDKTPSKKSENLEFQISALVMEFFKKIMLAEGGIRKEKAASAERNKQASKAPESKALEFEMPSFNINKVKEYLVKEDENAASVDFVSNVDEHPTKKETRPKWSKKSADYEVRIPFLDKKFLKKFLVSSEDADHSNQKKIRPSKHAAKYEIRIPVVDLKQFLVSENEDEKKKNAGSIEWDKILVTDEQEIEIPSKRTKPISKPDSFKNVIPDISKVLVNAQLQDVEKWDFDFSKFFVEAPEEESKESTYYETKKKQVESIASLVHDGLKNIFLH